LGLIFTSLVDIRNDDILELDQWNHFNVLDVEKIMHQTWLDMIKFDRLGGWSKIEKKLQFQCKCTKQGIERMKIESNIGLELWNL
jgi:hypothetical protein